MEDTLKFFLLAEYSGWNTSSYAFNYSQDFVKSVPYQVLSFNVIRAKEHISREARNIVDEYQKIKLKPTTLKEVFILETKLNYLALHSFPEYYLNPLTINTGDIQDIDTIGQLIININGSDHSINSLIMNDEITLDDKNNAVDIKIENYVFDMNNLINDTVKLLKNRTFKQDASNKKNLILTIIDCSWFFVANFLVLFTLIYPSKVYLNSMFNFSSLSLMTILSLVFYITTFLYDVFFIVFHSFKSKILEPINYARRFLKKNVYKLEKSVFDKAEELKYYIKEAINNKRELKDDIKSFSLLSSTYIDFTKIFNIEKRIKEKDYRILKTLHTVFTTISVLITILFLTFYLLSNLLNMIF